jgi:lipid-A-disaccharide synthase
LRRTKRNGRPKFILPVRVSIRIYNAHLRILISAGEASGDTYGAQLIEALRRLHPSAEFFGAGGDRMRAAGCDTVVDANDLAVVGISEILSHLPRIYSLFRQLISESDRRRPVVAVVIDSPAFNWRVARQMRKRGVSVVYYVCPQFWAWRQGRVRLLRKYVNKALVIFPFEEKFYRDRGVDATFVGHPLANLPQPTISREDYASQNNLDPAKDWITLMPGSRVKEVRMNLPEMLASAAALGTQYEFLLPLAPTLDRGFLQSLIGDRKIHLVTQALPAMAHSRGGIVASGTATVEAALMNMPFVMVYRVTPLTYFLGRSKVKVPYFAMVNLIASKEVVTELVQDDFTAAQVVTELSKVLSRGPAREAMMQGFAQVKVLLEGSQMDGILPADRAAQYVSQIIGENASEQKIG